MKNLSFALLVLSLLSISCSPKNRLNHKKEAHASNKVENHEEHKHWSYVGEEAPDQWSHISEAYKDCRGSAQSPINIIDNKDVIFHKEHKINIDYNTSAIEIVNNGHTEQFNISEGNKVVFDNKTYDLAQFHMHSLSEHTFDGQHLPLEVHFVNKAKDGTFAVIAVLFEEGPESPFFNHFLSHLPKDKNSKFIEKKVFDIHEILPDTKHFYHYSGSFTTPPCTEVVEWIIMKDKMTASKEQLNELHHLLHDNYRPIQKTNDRVVEEQ